MHTGTRITLVTPPSVFLLDERVFVSLGVLRVASSLQSRGVAVDHLDLTGLENHLDLLRDHLKITTSRFIGITATTPQLPSVAQIVALIRHYRPELKIILGGPHVTLTHSAHKLEQKNRRPGRAQRALAKLLELADVLVSGDGELAIFRAIAENAPRIIDADDPAHGYFLTNQQYDALPLPARELVQLSSYRYEIEGRPSTSLIAQLGCPFGCGFCGGRNSKSLRTIRTRSPQNILAEIEHLYRAYGYTGFMFYDDELNVNKEMLSLLRALEDLQCKLGVDFRFRGFVKAQLFTLEQARAMASAGFRWILVGFESGAERILENINKRATVAENDRAVEFAKAAGLKVKALMSVGHPGETHAHLEQTQNWLYTRRPDDFDCTIITAYPGTPYYDEALPHETYAGVYTYTQPRTGERLYSREVDHTVVADYYKGDPNGGYQSYVFTDHLSGEQLVAGRNWIEQSVRASLHIPYPQSRPALRYEHSMGQL